jgi:putative transposase
MNLDLMVVLDKQFLETPFYGVQQMTWYLRNDGHVVNSKRIRRLMRLMRRRRENSAPDCFLTLLRADLPEA